MRAPNGLIYLDGNSLGRLPKDTPEAITQAAHGAGVAAISPGSGVTTAVPATVLESRAA